MIRVSGFFLFLSLILLGWAGYEIGLWSLPLASAKAEAEKKVEEEESPEEEKKEEKKEESESISALRQRLKKIESAVEIREKKLAVREQEISDKERLLAKEVERYEKIIAKLRKEVEASRILKADQKSSVRNIYEKMDPKRSSKIFNKLDLDLTTALLAKMKPTQAALILGQMDSNRARIITERFLGKRIPASSKLTNKSESKGGE